MLGANKGSTQGFKGGAALALQALPVDAEPPSPRPPQQGVSQPTAVGLGRTQTVTSVLRALCTAGLHCWAGDGAHLLLAGQAPPQDSLVYFRPHAADSFISALPMAIYG